MKKSKQSNRSVTESRRFQTYRKRREALTSGSGSDAVTGAFDPEVADELAQEELIYPFHTILKRLSAPSWLQAQVLTGSRLAGYVLDLLKSCPSLIDKPQELFSPGRNKSCKSLIGRDLLATRIATVATPFASMKSVRAVLLDIDYDKSRTPNRLDNHFENDSWSEASLFGEALADSIYDFLPLCRNHPALLVDEFESVDPLEVLAVLSVFEWSNMRGDYENPDTWNESGKSLLTLMLVFNRYWIRPLADWRTECLNVGENLISLFAHLFLLYPIPKALFPHFDGRKYSRLTVCVFIWALFLGRGASLHRFAARFGWHIPKGFVAALFRVKPDMACFDQTCLAAECLRLGAGAAIKKFVASHFSEECRAFMPSIEVFSPFADPSDFQEEMGRGKVIDLHVQRWEQISSIILWFSRHENQLDPAERRVIASWMRHLISEEQRKGNFLLIHGKRFALSKVRRDALLYREQLTNSLDSVRPQSWPSLGLDREFQTADGVSWKFSQLLTSGALAEEGRFMRHCAVHYASACLQGRSAIFAVTRENTRSMTVEIRPSDLAMIQIKARCNKRPEEDAIQAAHQWHANITGGKQLQT